MKLIKGQYNSTKVFTDNIEDSAINQIETICNQNFLSDSKIRIMPDCHSGAGCTIGTTMTISDKVIPNLVGKDIGCGMITVELGNIELDSQKIDDYITNNIPHGFNINDEIKFDFTDELSKLRCLKNLGKTIDKFNKSIGTLGGGNHFIELNVDDDNNKYLVIHSGSRNLGARLATYYQNKAIEYHNQPSEEYVSEKDRLINEYKNNNKHKEISKALKELNKKYSSDISNELCYLEGDDMNDYLYDISIIQEYASNNRFIMAQRIINECMGLDINNFNHFQTIHNYIDLDNMILRKGAISAQQDEKVLIPINMRDGSLVCIGKGNEDWNYSAPHGAGRLMSRTKAKQSITLNEFKDSMNGIYTSSVCNETIDEAAFAYKPMNEIINNIQDTVDIVKIIKPIYNFKSK